MTVSIHLPDRMVVVHTEPDQNINLSTSYAQEALDAVELVRQVLGNHIATRGGESPVPASGVRWQISESPYGG